MENIREIALESLLELEKGKDFSNKLIKNVLDKYDYLENRDKSFLKRLIEGTIERKIELDYYINSYSKVPVNKMKPFIRCLMRMGSYQIIYMEAVPDSAAVNESIKLVKKHKFNNLTGFVNAILRKISVNKLNLPLPEKSNEKEYLSVKYSMPEWIVSLWIQSYGSAKTEEILKGLLGLHPVSIRFPKDMPQAKKNDYIKKMTDMGVTLKESKYLPFVYIAQGINGVASLPGFKEGDFTIQDVSSALAISEAGIKNGDWVLDICAAPGGKSMLAAEYAGKTGKVLSRDVSFDKVSLINENISRMGITNIETEVFDATKTDEKLKNKFDVVIMDLPCSGLGVMGKKRDIKYNVSRESLKSINDLQKAIVRGSYDYAKPGGILLYSTCTINPEENEDMVDWICEEFPYEVCVSKRQIFPVENECDGFFYAVLRRKTT